MRVLFYEDPLTERHNWAWRVGHIWYDAVTLRRLREQGVACRMVVNELGRDEAVARGCDEADLVVVPEAELRAVLPDPQERVNYLFHDRFFYDLHRTDGPRERARLWWRLLGGDRAHALMRRYALDVHDRLRDFYRARLGGFVPDVVTAWCPVPFLRTLFPRAEALVKEAGFFGATPFPWSHYYDPCGFHAHSWPRRHFARARAADPAALAALARLREEFVPLIASSSPFRDRVRALRQQYRWLVVVALQANNYFLFDRSCGYRSQAHVLIDVASHLPADAAVLVTRHPNTDLTALECSFLRQRFPNLILDGEFERVQAPTQYLLAEADLLVTIGSAVGWMAGFLHKPMVSVADCHLTPLSAVGRLTDLPALLADPARAPADDAHLAWVMFHYSIPQSLYDRDGFARRLFERFRRRDADPFADPVLPYAEYAELIAGTARRDSPQVRPAA